MRSPSLPLYLSVFKLATMTVIVAIETGGINHTNWHIYILIVEGVSEHYNGRQVSHGRSQKIQVW